MSGYEGGSVSVDSPMSYYAHLPDDVYIPASYSCR